MPTSNIAPVCSIHYLDPNSSGSPSVLLLHGLGATGESWGLQIPALIEAGYRPIAPDARGFGKSTYPGGSHTIEAMAGDMAALLDRLGAEAAHVVGISMGGTLALSLALHHPQKVDKLVLVNTFSSLRPDKLSIWLYFAFRLVLVHTLGLETQAKAVAGRIFPAPEQNEMRRVLVAQICQADPWGYRATMRALARFNVVERLGEIRAPTLVITGADDTTIPPKNQKTLVERIPGARQIVIPNAGHAVTAQQPEAFNQEMCAFLKF